MATRYRIACVFDLTTESVVYIGATSEFYRNHEKLINYLDSFVYGAGIPVVVIVVVTAATIIAAIKNSPGCSMEGGDFFSKRTFAVVVLVSDPVSYTHLTLPTTFTV